MKFWHFFSILASASAVTNITGKWFQVFPIIDQNYRCVSFEITSRPDDPSMVDVTKQGLLGKDTKVLNQTLVHLQGNQMTLQNSNTRYQVYQVGNAMLVTMLDARVPRTWLREPTLLNACFHAETEKDVLPFDSDSSSDPVDVQEGEWWWPFL
jgi:hypothetical protein